MKAFTKLAKLATTEISTAKPPPSLATSTHATSAYTAARLAQAPATAGKINAAACDFEIVTVVGVDAGSQFGVGTWADAEAGACNDEQECLKKTFKNVP